MAQKTVKSGDAKNTGLLNRLFRSKKKILGASFYLFWKYMTALSFGPLYGWAHLMLNKLYFGHSEKKSDTSSEKTEHPTLKNIFI